MRNRRLQFTTFLLLVLCLCTTACDLKKKSSGNGEEALMVSEIMDKRFTARTFYENREVKKEHINQILKAGLLVPSKDSIYPYEILAVTNSPKGREYRKTLWKKNLVYTHCLKSGEAVTQYINSVRTAPLTILFLENVTLEPGDMSPSRRRKKNHKDFVAGLRHRSTRDALIAATSMLIQAEQLGYATAFSAAFSENVILPKIIQHPGAKFPIVAVSVGHAVPANEIRPRNYNGIEMDFDCKGRVTRATDFIFLEDPPVQGEKAVIRALDKGPRNRHVPWDRIKRL